MERIETSWTKEELKAYTLLYFAHADFKFTEEEVEYIKSKVSEDKYKKIWKEFKHDNDYQSLQKIEHTVERFNYSQDEIDKLFKEIKELFFVDEKYDTLEKNLYLGLQHLMHK